MPGKRKRPNPRTRRNRRAAAQQQNTPEAASDDRPSSQIAEGNGRHGCGGPFPGTTGHGDQHSPVSTQPSTPQSVATPTVPTIAGDGAAARHLREAADRLRRAETPTERRKAFLSVAEMLQFPGADGVPIVKREVSEAFLREGLRMGLLAGKQDDIRGWARISSAVSRFARLEQAERLAQQPELHLHAHVDADALVKKLQALANERGITLEEDKEQ